MLLLLCWIQISCTGTPKTLVLYEGERQPPERVALITSDSPGTFITGVDSHRKRKPFYIKARYIEVLPGFHQIEVAYSMIKGPRVFDRRTSRDPMLLELDAKADHVYGVKTRSGLRRWQAWIIDLTDSTVVVDKQEGFLQ